VGVELARLPEQTARVAVNGVLPHLDARDLTTLYVSRAPLEKLQEER
jgi:predicted dithiol-disulfide oxidoreductase (DUF899 family)